MPKDGRNPQTGGEETLNIQSASIITRIKNIVGIGSDGAESYSGEIRIRIIKPVSALYRISDNVGDIIEINAKQGSEMIASGHAEIVE